MASEGRRSRKSFGACCFAQPQVEDEQAVTKVKANNSMQQQKASVLTTAAVTAHAGAADACADFGMASPEKVAAGAPRKSVDKGMPAAQLQAIPEMPNIKPLMALSLNRPYTDSDWFAAMAALEKVQKIQQARALQQLRASNHGRSSVASQLGHDDDTEAWYDARSHTMSDSSVAFISDAERDEVAKLAHELETHEHQQQQLTVAIGRELQPCLPSCVPNPPLLFAEKHWKYCQVDLKPFCFYWERDPMRSSPFPLPIDEQMKLNSLFQKTHQSIPGMWLREVGDQLLLHAQPTIMAIPGIVNYTEYYNKDQSPCSWTLRRDIKVGKTTGQMFMTTDGLLIFRVFTSGVFSKAIEWIGEDYIRLEDNGETIVTRQLCKLSSDNSTCSQYLVGRKIGNCPPKRNSMSH